MTVLLVSNIASAAKLIDLGITIFGLRLAFDGGTLLFPLAYIFGDTLTEVYGYGRSRRVIWMGFACALLMSVVFWVLARLPGDSAWGQFVYQNMSAAVPGLTQPARSGGVWTGSL